jgi:hypothetical protein
MLVYYESQKPIVNELRDEGWQSDLIQKYLAYVNRKTVAVKTGRSSMRDSTRGKTYKAEWKFQQLHKADIKTFKTEKQVQAYVKRVLNSKLWQEMTNGKHVDVSVRTIGHRTAGRAYGYKIEINSMNGMDQYTILHELAHCAGHMHHDVSFRLCALKLVSRFIGREAAKTLKACFKEQKLRMTMPTGYSDPETWLANYKKMEKVRSKAKKVA